MIISTAYQPIAVAMGKIETIMAAGSDKNNRKKIIWSKLLIIISTTILVTMTMGEIDQSKSGASLEMQLVFWLCFFLRKILAILSIWPHFVLKFSVRRNQLRLWLMNRTLPLQTAQ